jgi:hypothetical protein
MPALAKSLTRAGRESLDTLGLLDTLARVSRASRRSTISLGWIDPLAASYGDS